MKRYTFHILLLLIALLIGILATMWFHRDGSLRNIHWQPPEAQIQDFATMVPTLAVRKQADTSQFLGMLERPLFSPTRRPPPPPPPPAPVEAPEPLPNMHLYGIYGGGSGGGAIVRVDGKNQRVHLNEAINGWMLKSIGERSVTFVRGGRSHSIDLVHVVPGSTGSAPSAAGSSTSSPQGQTPKRLTRSQQIQEARDRQRADRDRAASERAASTPTSP